MSCEMRVGLRTMRRTRQRFLADEVVETTQPELHPLQPLGAFLAVMPWNFPSGK